MRGTIRRPKRGEKGKKYSSSLILRSISMRKRGDAYKENREGGGCTVTVKVTSRIGEGGDVFLQRGEQSEASLEGPEGRKRAKKEGKKKRRTWKNWRFS